jgi:glc operon protein GlcG
MTLVVAADMSLLVARALLDEVERQAAELRLALAAVVVDRGGNPVASMRMDGAQLGAMSIAGDKALTAVSFGRGTSAWSDTSAPGGSDWGLAGTLDGRAIVFAGGLPTYSDGVLVGALGVSGASSDLDERCAELAVKAAGLEASA